MFSPRIGLQKTLKYVKIVLEGYGKMTSIKKNEKYIPTKNYIKAVLFIVVVILISLYIFEWYRVYEENKVMQSYLIKSDTIHNEIKDTKEVEAIFTEVPDDYFVYVSYTGNKDIYEMEKELKDVIREYDLKDKFYFINVTNMKEEDNYLEELGNILNLNEQKITEVPTIIYFKDGEIVKDGILTSEDDNIINASDFRKFLEEKEYQK